MFSCANKVPNHILFSFSWYSQYVLIMSSLLQAWVKLFVETFWTPLIPLTTLCHILEIKHDQNGKKTSRFGSMTNLHMAKLCLFKPFFLVSNTIYLFTYFIRTSNWHNLLQVLNNEESTGGVRYCLVMHMNMRVEHSCIPWRQSSPCFSYSIYSLIEPVSASLWKTARTKIIPGSYSQF